MTIPGVGELTAMAIHTFAPPMESFRTGRDFGGMDRAYTARILDGWPSADGTDHEDGSARHPEAALPGGDGCHREYHSAGKVHTDPWLARMLDEKPRKVVAVALANRMARIIWAVDGQGGELQGAESQEGRCIRRIEFLQVQIRGAKKCWLELGPQPTGG